MSDEQRSINLQLELAAIVDIGEQFVKATYYLEGDGPLVFSCYERLQTASEACQAPHFPNVRAVSSAIVRENPMEQAAALEQRAKTTVDPAIQWFLRKFNVELYDIVRAFKVARIMCPVAVQWLRPTTANVEALRIFPFLNSDVRINDLITELPNYLAAAHGVVVATEEEKVVWWSFHAVELPRWSAAVKQVLLVQPSSSTTKRAFSLLSSCFNDLQDHVLVDYLQTSVMLQYDKR